MNNRDPKVNVRHGRGKGLRKVPFFCHSVVPCMDLVVKVVSEIGVPALVEEQKNLAVQLCFDLACSIRDRIQENRSKLDAVLTACERGSWERRSGAVRDCYQELDKATQRSQEDDAYEKRSIEYVRRLRPNTELMADPDFLALWKNVAPHVELTLDTPAASSPPNRKRKRVGSFVITISGTTWPGRNLAKELEGHSIARGAKSTEALVKARANLLEAKRKERTHIRDAVADELRQAAIEGYDATFNLPHSRMVELSDVSQRLAFLDGKWLADFWERADKHAKNVREFSPGAFALREWSEAQEILDREIHEAVKKNRKANCGNAFQEWVLRSGVRYGLDRVEFNYRAMYKACTRQDCRVDAWLRTMGKAGLAAYLAEDKTADFALLESRVQSKLLRTDNEFAVMAGRVGNPSNELVDLGDTIGPIFPNKAHVLRKMNRFLAIRNRNDE